MTSQLDADRVLEDWLAQGPSQPRSGPSTKRSADSTVSDSGGPRGFRGVNEMNRLILSASAVAAAVIVAVVALGPLTDGPPVGGPPGVAFISERHGYTVVLPADRWYREERPGTWELGEFFDANSDAGVDYFEDQVSTLGPPPTWYVYLASQAIPEGVDFEAWVALHDAATDRDASCFQQSGSYERRPLDGETARIGTYRCEQFGEQLVPWTTVQTLVAHRGRGYAIYVWPVQTGSQMPPVAEIEAAADDWLAGFSFND